MPPRRTSFFQTCLGVFQGGGCRAAAFAGAYEAATSRGVHFAAVAGTSAGSITAALIGAGASPKTLDGMLHELDFQRFVASPAERTVGGGLPLALRLLLGSIPTRRFRHLLLRQGMYSSRSIEDWLDVKLRELLGIRNRRVVFSDLVLPTWVVATDIVTRKVKVWSQEETPNDEVARAVRASCSIPFFFQPVGNRYVDGGALSNLPAFVFPPYRRPLARRVLAFSLVSDDEGSETENTFNLIGAIMSTVVDGAEDLQLKVQPDVHVISISTGSVKATDFDKMTPSIIDDLIARGAETTHQFFDDELAKVHAPPPPPDVVCTGTDETYTRIVENLDRQIDEILVAEETAQWIYPLFPAFLYWRAHGTRVRVVLRESHAPPASDDQYQRRLLSYLGAHVCAVPSVPTRAFIFNPGDPEAAVAVVRVGRANVDAIHYDGSLHFKAIEALSSQIRALCSHMPADDTTRPTIEKGGHDELLARLRTVTQYSGNVRLTVETLPLSSLQALTSQVREFKYRQAKYLADLYQQNGIDMFEPARVRLAGGMTSIVTPPVVEESKEFILIQGSTRAVYCRDQEIDRVTCVVARGVRESLPSEGLVPLTRVGMVGTSVSLAERYGTFKYNLFRDIERRVHPVGGLQ